MQLTLEKRAIKMAKCAKTCNIKYVQLFKNLIFNHYFFTIHKLVTDEHREH